MNWVSSLSDLRDAPQKEWDKRVRKLAEDFATAVTNLNQARDSLRAVVADIAGCDVSEWSIKDCMAYADLALRKAKEYE